MVYRFSNCMFHLAVTRKAARARPIAPTLFLFVCLLTGCTEDGKIIDSIFSLSKESRLPSWYVVPAATRRDQVTCKIVFFAGNEVEFQISIEGKIVERDRGISRPHPIMGDRGYINFPNYTVITVKEKFDIYEQRAPTDTLSITDDSRLLGMLKQPG